MILVVNVQDYSNADWKVLEKNHRVVKVFLGALSEADESKVIQYKSTKEIWDIYDESSEKMRTSKEIKLTVAKVYEKVSQGKNETLEDFHAQFKHCVLQMQLLGGIDTYVEDDTPFSTSLELQV